MSKQKVKELQDKFALVNKNGSTMKITTDSGLVLDGIMPDSFIVLEFEGDHPQIMWREIGFDLGGQYSKRMIFEEIIPEDITQDEEGNEGWITFDMKDDSGRPYHVELIEPNMEAPLHESWLKWQAYKKANKEKFKAIADHIRKWSPDVAWLDY